MRLLTVSAFVLFVASAGLAAQDKPTVKQCKANLNEWVSMFKAAYDDPACRGDGSPSCPFAAAIRDLDIGRLVHIPFEAEACAKVNRRRRYDYQRVATRAENIVVMRTAYFLKSEAKQTYTSNGNDLSNESLAPPKHPQRQTPTNPLSRRIGKAFHCVGVIHVMPEWQHSGDLLDPNHGSERRDLSRPRPHASHP